MKTQLDPHTWQQLSDFLDDQLSPREKADLEKRLAERADFRAGLEELKQTRAVLKAAPHRRAPRNFTLKPDMVRVHRKLWRGWTPTFSFASVAAALVAGVMLIGQLLPMPMAAPMMASAPMEAPAAESAAEPTPLIITWGDQSPAGMGMGGGGGGAADGGYGGAAPVAPDYSTEKSAEPTPLPQPTPMPAEPQLEPTPGVQALAPSAVEESGDTENLILGIAPTEQQGQILIPESVSPEREQARQPLNWLPWITGGLFAVAILFAFFAIRLRRR